MSAPAPTLARSFTLGGPPMTRTEPIVSAFPIPLLRTSSNASGRPQPTWAPVKGPNQNQFNPYGDNPSELQGRFASDLEAADLKAASERDTARWEKVLKHDPHSAIHQAKLTAEILRCSDLIKGIKADEKEDEKAASATLRG